MQSTLENNLFLKKMASSGAQRRLAGESKPRPGASSYLAAYMLGLICHIGDSSVAGNHFDPCRVGRTTKRK